MSNFRIYNETLCPDFWDEYQHLDSRVRVNLLRMAYDFYKKTKLPAPIVDVYLMGSIANYNWTPDSDADVHIMVDYTKMQMPPETANKTVKTVGAQWNAEHNVLIKGHKVEMNLQNVNEVKPHVTGIYSLVKDAWVRHPQRVNLQIDKGVVQTQYKAMKSYIDSALNSGNRETMKAAKEYLDAYRQYGLDTAGELSYENIVFKILRSKGIIRQLKDSIVQAYDKEMSLAELTQKDIEARFPLPNALYKGDANLKMMTLGNLKSMRDKAARMLKYHSRNPEDSQLAQKAMSDYKMYNDEIRKRLAYINRAVGEGYGAGDPSTDPIATGRWRVKFGGRKTPKMKEDIDPSITKMPQPEHPLAQLAKLLQPQRINLFPKDPMEDLPKEIRDILKVAETVLDKRSKQGQKFFTTEYMWKLMDDILSMYLPSLPRGSERQMALKRALIYHLASDYDIRHEGQRIAEGRKAPK